MPDQRSGANSRLVWYPETTFKSDVGITEGFISTLADVDALDLRRRNIIPLTIYKGDREPLRNVQGLINSGGGVPLFADFRFLGHMLTAFLGKAKADGTVTYKRAGGRHQWSIGTPRSGQWEKVSLEPDPTALTYRGRGIRLSDMEWPTEQEGAARYTVRSLGSGDVVHGTAGLIASPTDEPFEEMNYLNGSISKAGVELFDVTDFSVMMHNGSARSDFRFNKGIANQITSGKFRADGNLGLAFTGHGFYDEAVAETRLFLECVWANKPLDALPDKFLRYFFPAVFFGTQDPHMGGEPGINQVQPFQIEKPSVGLVAEIWAGLPPTYNIGASTSIAGVKVNGGAPVSKTLTTGAARTAQQIVDDLNASGGIAGATSVVFLGRPAIRHLTTGLTQTLQIDTSVANSAHTVLGWDNVIRSGYDPTAFMAELQNGFTTDYP